MNYKKCSTKQLLGLLDSKTISHDDLIDVKTILKYREERQQKALQAIEKADVDGLLNTYELNWEINLFPLAVAVVSPAEEDFIENLEAVHFHDTLHWPLRMDNNRLIGRFACNGDKPILQNKDMIELGIRLANSDDSEVTFAKAIGDGGSIMIAIRAGDPVVVGPDKVQRYIYLLDNRTGEHGLRIGFGETNLRCSNQLNFVNRNAAHSLRHTKTLPDRLSALIDTYDTLAEEMDTHHQFVESLAARTYDRVQFDAIKYQFIDLLFDVDLKEDFTNVRTPAGYNESVLLDDCIEEEAEQIGLSLWTLLNGVTLMTTHRRADLYPRSETPELEKDIAYGKAGEIAAKAYEILLTL